jgi:hypothetical protein
MVVVNAMRPPPANLRLRIHPSAEIPTAPIFRAASFVVLAGLLLAAVLTPVNARAQPSGASQYDVEAVYLYNFAKFVRWPAGRPGATINICVAAQKVFVDSLTKVVAGEQIETRPLTVRTIQRPEDEAACDILFIDSSAKERLDGLLTMVSSKPILTVSDIPDFLDRGGMIQLLLVGNRMRFTVDLRPIARSGIALSSELLKVAVAVRGQSAGGGAP